MKRSRNVVKRSIDHENLDIDFTLQPGDLIWTGTMGRTRALDPGDTYEVEVEGVGVLSNPVVQGR